MTLLSTRTGRLLLALVAGQALLAGLVAGGCGGDLSNIDPISLDTWDRPKSGSDPADNGSGNTVTPPDDANVEHVPQVVTNPVNPVVDGEVIVREETPVLYVDVIKLDFGPVASVASFTVTNVGSGLLDYRVGTDVTWATVSLVSGQSEGESDAVAVYVNRTNLPPGVYNGIVAINATNGEQHVIALVMSVPTPTNPDGPPPPPQPTLTLATDTVDFGPDSWTRGFTLTNTGTPFNFTLTCDQPWLTLSTSGGTLGAETRTITLEADRLELDTGAHTATVTIGTNVGLWATVTVRLEKPLTTPLVIPWIEVNIADEAEVDHCVAGLIKWRRVTDTAVVSTNTGREWLYTTLKQRVPGMKVIPGIKTASRLGLRSFDNVAGWQRIATSAALMNANAGLNVVVLENETALMSYWFGGATINFEQLGQGLALLPSNIEYIWFPSVHSRQAWLQQKSATLCEFVNSQIDTRFVDQSYCHPLWPMDPPWIQNRATLEALASKPILPIVYFGQFYDTFFWDYSGTLTAMQWLQGRDEALFYPGKTRWVESAEAINRELWSRP